MWRTGSGAATSTCRRYRRRRSSATGSDRLTDPRILYDAPSGRWFASISDVDTNSVMLAVSTQRRSDRRAGPSSSFLAAGLRRPAAPRLRRRHRGPRSRHLQELRAKAVAPALGSELWIVNKQQLARGLDDARRSTTFGPERQYESLAPGAVALRRRRPSTSSRSNEPSSRVVHLLAVDGIPPAAGERRKRSPLPPITPLSGRRPRRSRPAADRAGVSRRSRRTTTACSTPCGRTGSSGSRRTARCTAGGRLALRACARVIELATATRHGDDGTPTSGSPARTSSIPRSGRTAPGIS